ncbi:thiaminase II [Acetobacteraceae bacterium]|nr:thiaminase II [Acetobacteraceae bacterium]
MQKIHFLTSFCLVALCLPSLSFAAKAHQKFSDEAWQKIAPIYEKIRQHPFNQELEKGTLDKKKFDFYASQDTQFVEDYTKALATLATKLDNPKSMDKILEFTRTALSEATFEVKGDWLPQKTRNPAPATLLYTNFTLATAAYKSREELAAALLPCFWIYAHLGNEIAQKAILPNPYEKWIHFYSNTNKERPLTEENIANGLIDITDQLAEKATPETRQKMLDAFVLASRMELNFWDAAYKLENWQ